VIIPRRIDCALQRDAAGSPGYRSPKTTAIIQKTLNFPEIIEMVLKNSPHDLLAGHALPVQVLQDLYLLAELEPDRCRELAKALHELDRSDDASQVPDIVNEKLGTASDDTKNAVLRLVANVTKADVDSTFTTLSSWVDANERRQEAFDAARLKRVEENLRAVADDFPIVALNRKAQEIVRSVGNEFADVRCYCDLRPVFDDNREVVDAFVLLANLRLAYLTQSGDRQVVELALTEDELRKIRSEIDRTLQKIERLKPVAAQLLEGPSGQGGEA